MRYLYTVVLLLVSAKGAFAMGDSARINVNLLHYSSAFERQQFIMLNNTGSFDALSFLLCLDSTINPAKEEELKVKLNNIFDEKLTPIFNKEKNRDKALKLFFKEIHDNLLNKYVLNTRFERLLDVGEYNCLTASALYAFAFERFHIPYQLRSLPDHVYVIANPGIGETVIETTDPVNGAYQYSEAYKKNYIEQQVKHKMISKDEYASNSIEYLFKKYFFTSDTIDFKQLIGYHYYNNAIELMSKENFVESTNQLMKAYTLNQSKKVEYLLSVALSVVVNQSFDITDSGDIEKYFLLERLIKEKDKSFLYSKYTDACEEIGMRQDDLPKLTRISNYLFSNIEDSSELVRFKEKYYLVRGTNYITKEDLPNGYENFLIAYYLNNKDVRIKAAYTEVENIYASYLSEEEGSEVDTLTAILNRNAKYCPPALQSEMKLKMLLTKAAMAFKKEKIQQGNADLLQAKLFIDSIKPPSLNHAFIARAYMAGEIYYYKKYEIERAMGYLNEGLKTDPGNTELTTEIKRLSTFRGYAVPKGNDYKSSSKVPSSASTPSSKPVAPLQPRTVIVHTTNP